MTLIVRRTGAGSGTITSSPPGITCGDTCQGEFASGSVVTLFAAPAAGSRLASWGGACSGTSGCVLTLTGDTSVDAQFATALAYRMTELSLPIAIVIDINEAGQVLGFQCSDAICTESTPFLWSPESGEVTYLETGRWLPWTAALNDRGAALLQDYDHDYWVYADGQARPILPDRQVESGHLGNQGWIVGLLSTPTGPDAFLYEPDRDTLIIFGHGHYDVTSVNGAGDIVGHANGRAVVFEPDGDVVDLGLGVATPVVVTEGRRVYGWGGDSYDVAGAYTPPFGFVHDLRTGETTRFDAPEGKPREFVLDGNDRGEALLPDALWSAGHVSTLEELAGMPIMGGVAINSAGQILVHFERGDGRLRVGVLTPGE